MPHPYVLVAPNGARRSRADHPALPVTTAEIVSTAHACQQAGADGLHLHVRDKHGVHSLDQGHYRETLAELRQSVPGLDLQITTEAAGIFDVASQLQCLEGLQPTWASISVREIARAPDLAERVYGTCSGQGTRVQHILYNQADAALLDRWQAAGIVRQDQVERLFVLGRYETGQEEIPGELGSWITDNPPTTPWMVCAFGATEHSCLRSAGALGADLRVGFENSLTDPKGSMWVDNATSVAALKHSLEGAIA
tara:strand:- start:1328 stop:2086 length:759 start_codon:yes stop_codon:yes gene_type:complete